MKICTQLDRFPKKRRREKKKKEKRKREKKENKIGKNGGNKIEDKMNKKIRV